MFDLLMFDLMFDYPRAN